MSRTNHLNVYKGPDSMRDYFDPDCLPPLPLVEIPACLNPYASKGIRIYGKMMSMHPANNVKALPAMNLLQHSVDPAKTKTVIEYSSGSTVISMAMTSRIFHNVPDVRAFLSNKTSQAKLRLMQFFGLDITLFGGPSQPEPIDPRGGIERAKQLSSDNDDTINPNQYENDMNWQSHVRWTGPQILKQLPEINVICAGMGTSGTMTGLGTFFKKERPDVTRLGVCTAAGDRVPGPRSYALLAPVEFPWREAIDEYEEVGSFDSYSLSLELCRQGLICGPSSGFNLKGLYKFIERREKEGRLEQLRGPDGNIHCVFVCCDLPYQYIDDYFSKLGAAPFPKINNEHLTKVDLYRYDEKWEIAPLTAVSNYFSVADWALTPHDATVIFDLRNVEDFDAWHLPGSMNLPLNTLRRGGVSPFFDPATLEAQWIELERLFAPDSDADSDSGNDSDGGILQRLTSGHQVLAVCYDGDTSRIANSVLRAKGIASSSIRGGVTALLNELPMLRRRYSTQSDTTVVADADMDEDIALNASRVAEKTSAAVVSAAEVQA